MANSGALCLLLSLVLASSVGCGDDTVSVFVELQTDYIPGVEFEHIEVRLDGRLVRREDAPAGLDFVEALRIAELDGITLGTHFVELSLIEARGAGLASRRISVDVRESLAVVVRMARLCTADCPGPGDSADATECFGNRCVTPACRPGETEACGPAECESDTDCRAVAMCSAPMCVAGECLLGIDSGRCASDERCDPEAGCVGVSPPTDAAVDTSVMDSGALDTTTPDTGVTDTGISDVCVPAPVELCDGVIDDDCNGMIDEGCNCVNGATRSCGPALGACSTGMETCVSGAWDGVCVGIVVPTPYEECLDGIDGDCDGVGDGMDDCCATRTFGTHTYLFCTASRGSFNGSEIECNALAGHDLVEVNDDAENAFLAAEAVDSQEHWIGLTDSAVEGTFVWTGPGTSSYRNWGTGQPDNLGGNQHCVVMNGTNGRWNDVPCSRTRRFICEQR